MNFDVFVGQFVMAQSGYSAPNGWRGKSLSGWYLYTHPTTKVIDLVDEVDQPVGWLLGEPALGRNLVDGRFRIHAGPSSKLEADDTPPLEAQLYELGGPWVAIVLGEHPPRVFTDAFGHLSVVYSPVVKTIATSPSLIPVTQETQLDERLTELMRIPAEDNWYPFGLTPRKNVARLLPNHYLDLDRWEPVRHWPHSIPAEIVSVDEATAVVATVLKRNINALAVAYPLQMSLTAGYDSRMILACTREYTSTMRFITNHSHPSTAALDVAAASYFAKRYGFDHVVRQPQEATGEEQAAWLHQVGAAAAGAAFHHLCLTNLYGTERVRLSGHGCPVLRGVYYNSDTPKVYSSQYSAEEVVSHLRVPWDEQVIRAAETWLGGITDCSGETLLDLLYVENRMGCWAGPIRFGGTSAHRNFWPICHRSILDLMLRLLPETKRTSRIHTRVVEQEWPELLEIPVNEWFGWEKTKRDWLRELKRLQPVRVYRGIRRRINLGS